MTGKHHIEETAITVLGIDAKSDLGRFLLHVRENPTVYAAGLLLTVLAILAGFVWRGSVQASERNVMSDYAAALLETEDEAIRATKLEQLAEQVSGRWAPEVVYMAGESALSQGATDKAAAAFERVLKDFPQSEYASRAAEGQAYIAESKGDFQAALAGYQGVAEKYGATFTGKLQQNNIGRVQEALKNFQGAVDAYKKQQEVFPDSMAAAKAKEALDRLKSEHPELFPAETPAPAADAAAATPDTAATPAPAPAPAAEAPAAAPAEAPAPAAEAPATPAETPAAPAQ